MKPDNSPGDDSPRKSSPIQQPNTQHSNMQQLLMPSFFETLNSRSSTPMPNKEYLVYMITHSANVKNITQRYRQMVKVNDEIADKLKLSSPAISPSVVFNGKGRSFDDFVSETLWLMLDFDFHDDKLDVEELIAKAKATPEAMVVYTTISGRGFRILLRYIRPSVCTLSATALHSIAIGKAVSYYEHLLGCPADHQCLEMTRLCGFAHDPNAYFCWTAQPITISQNDIEAYQDLQNKRKQQQQQYESTTGKGKKGRPRKAAASGEIRHAPTFSEIIKRVKKQAESWSEQFVPQHHHNYALRFARFCHNYGADKDELSKWMRDEFGNECPDIDNIIRWVYNRTNELGCWSISEDYMRSERQASVKAILQWLGSHYEFHQNTISGQYQVRSINDSHPNYLEWTNIDTKVRNSIYVKMELEHVHTNVKKLDSIIQSNISPEYNPMEDYLKSLPPWDESQPDYIKQLADTVEIEENANYYHTHDDFVYAFKKWMVNMVVTWCEKDIINESIVIFVGKGGINKTTFFDHLLPLSLREYFANDSTGDYTNKDFLDECSSKALICLDECSAMQGKNLSCIKSTLTKRSINLRRNYEVYSSMLNNHAGFCGTSNSLNLISEEENRRFSIWHVLNIQSPIKHPFNYEGIYSQAVYLGRKVLHEQKEGKKSDWVFWPTEDDLRKIRCHNQMFLVNDYLAELISQAYTVPTKKTPRGALKFVTAANIVTRFCTNSVISREFSTRNVRDVMARFGFQLRHRNTGNGWWVQENSGFTIEERREFGPDDEI